MARRLGRSNQYVFRYRFLLPRFLQLEDRLQPGSMFDFFGVTATDMPWRSRPVSAQHVDSTDAPVVSLVNANEWNFGVTEVAIQDDQGVPMQRKIVRIGNSNLPDNHGLNDPLAVSSNFVLGLEDAASIQSLGLAAVKKATRPAISAFAQTSAAKTPSAGVLDSVASNKASLSATNPDMTMRPVNEFNPSTVPAINPVSAAEDLETSGPARVPDGGNPYDPNQPLRPYSLTFDGSRDAPTTGVVESIPEFAPSKGMLLRYGLGNNNVVTDIVARTTGDPDYNEIAYVLVTSASQQTSATNAFIAAGADMSKVQFSIQPGDAVWIRDYGPHFITVDGALAINDSVYYSSRPQDDFIPTLVGDNIFNLPTYDMNLYWSGGNFQPGANNIGFTTTLMNTQNPVVDGYDSAFVSQLWNTYQGVNTLHVMPKLPTSVDSTGHIDMWFMQVDADTVVISEFQPGSNATAIQITNDAVTYMENIGYEVFRTPAWNPATSVNYTYTQAFRLNNRIFMPVYGTAIVPGGNSSYNDEDAAALAVWQAAAPGMEIVPIQSNGIIGQGGAGHCIIMQVPEYQGTAPAVDVVSPTGGEIWLKGSQQTIRWSAIDTGNTDPALVDIYYSPVGGPGGRNIASNIPDTGSFTWTVMGRESTNAVIRVIAKSTDGDETIAYSAPFTIKTGISHVYDFSTGAGVDKFAYGNQTTSWASSVNGNPSPVVTQLSGTNYTALSTSNATGGDGDANRYISPQPSGSSESTHTFNFNLSESISDIDEIELRWEGYADECTTVELYVWDVVAQQWGNGKGVTGQNRYVDNWAGNTDGELAGFIGSDISRYVDGSGTIRLLVYSDRPASVTDHGSATDETFHDYVSVTVKQV